MLLCGAGDADVDEDGNPRVVTEESVGLIIPLADLSFGVAGFVKRASRSSSLRSKLVVLR